MTVHLHARSRPVVVDDWTYRPNPQPPGTPQAVCFPHAGGDVTAFSMLAAALAPDLDVWVVRLPARGGRFAEPMPAGFTALVTAVRAGLWPHLRPGALFYGQSFGALLAYEVARSLPAGRRPSLVVPACASAPPHWPDAVPAADRGADLLDLCGIEVDDAVRDVAVATINADLRVCRTYRYRPGPVPGFAVHAVTGADDPMVRPADIGGWARTTTGPYSGSVEPGGHLLASPVHTGPADLLRSLRGNHDHHRRSD